MTGTVEETGSSPLKRWGLRIAIGVGLVTSVVVVVAGPTASPAFGVAHEDYPLCGPGLAHELHYQ